MRAMRATRATRARGLEAGDHPRVQDTGPDYLTGLVAGWTGQRGQQAASHVS
jgi:hypothetical protein